MPAAAPWQKILNAGITFRLCKISRHVSTVYSSSDSPPYFFSSFIVVLPIVIESVLSSVISDRTVTLIFIAVLHSAFANRVNRCPPMVFLRTLPLAFFRNWWFTSNT
jgi:hypothetical protein